MYLNRVEVSHFRNLTSVSLSPAKGLNILEGNNASGKTSFLEAVYMLGLARSFRTIKSNQLVQEGQDNLLLFAELSNGSTHHRLGLQRFLDNGMVIRLDGETVKSRARLAQVFPIQLTIPESISLLTGPPGERRQYLDWIMFHVEQGFHHTWTQFHRYIRQRNALLRDQRPLREIAPWTDGVAGQGEHISHLRRTTVEALEPHLNRFVGQLLPDINIEIQYRQGWKQGVSLAESLANTLDTDFKQKYTGAGPHRAELMLLSEGQAVTDVLSRGQLKLLLCALKLAQLDYLKQKTGKTSVVLIDDLPAELDRDNRSLLLKLLYNLNTQVFVTSTDRSHLDDSAWDDIKVFHVEHGKIKEVV